MTCRLCDPPAELPGTNTSDYLAHQRDVHLAVDFPDLNDWRTRAHAEVRRLGNLGEFQLWEVFRTVGDPPNHKTANGGFSQELEHLGLAHVVRYEPSRRPGSKKSAVAVWRGGPKPRQETTAA